MTTTHTRRTVLAVRSDDCFEELNLGVVRRFVAECDALRFDDGETVSVEVHGDALHRLVAENVDYQELEPPTADIDSVAGIERIMARRDAAQAAAAEQQRAGGGA